MSKIIKPWGHEIIWAHTEKYVGKILFIKNNHKLSRQYHNLKEETFMVKSGTLKLEIGLPEVELITHILKENDTFHCYPGTVHRMIANDGDVEVIEVSTPELDDVVRVEDDYGR